MHDFQGTQLTPETLHDNIDAEHVRYHFWAATKLVLKDLCAIEKRLRWSLSHCFRFTDRKGT